MERKELRCFPFLARVFHLFSLAILGFLAERLEIIVPLDSPTLPLDKMNFPLDKISTLPRGALAPYLGRLKMEDRRLKIEDGRSTTNNRTPWLSKPFLENEQKRITERKTIGVDKRNCDDMQDFGSETQKEILPSTCHLVSIFFNPLYWTAKSRGCVPLACANYRGACLLCVECLGSCARASRGKLACDQKWPNHDQTLCKCCLNSIQSSIPFLQSSIFDLQSSIPSLQASIFNLQPSLFDPHSSVFNLQSSVFDPRSLSFDLLQVGHQTRESMSPQL